MFTGCGTALVTPFARDFTLDEEALRRLVRRQIDAGIDFLVPCGTTGETSTLPPCSASRPRSILNFVAAPRSPLRGCTTRVDVRCSRPCIRSRTLPSSRPSHGPRASSSTRAPRLTRRRIRFQSWQQALVVDRRFLVQRLALRFAADRHTGDAIEVVVGVFAGT